MGWWSLFSPRVSLLRRSPLVQPVPIITQTTTVRHASVRKGGIDPKLDIIRRTLYPPHIRNTATPKGGYRPRTMRALRKAIPTAQVHEIIERGWKLYLRHKRQQRQAELERKFNSMKKAMEELTKVNYRLALAANGRDDARKRTDEEVALLKSLRGGEQSFHEVRIRSLFPRELRMPMDTPSRDGWNYEWNIEGLKKL